MADTTKRVRLAPDEYRQLARKFPDPVVTENTTAHQAGYLLGVQAVLQKLREGYVIGE